MSSDEENLDDLLKSIMESENESEHLASDDDSMENAGAEDENASDDFDLTIEDLGLDDEGNTESEVDDFAADGFAADDFAIEDFEIVEPEPGELEAEEQEIDGDSDSVGDDDIDTASDIADFAIEDFGVVEPEPEELLEESEEEAEEEFEEEDTTEEEPSIDSTDDMLALLESMSEEMENSENSDNSSKDNTNAEADEETGKKEKGVFSRLFSGKKKKKQTGENQTESINEKTDETTDKTTDEVQEWDKAELDNLFSEDEQGISQSGMETEGGSGDSTEEKSTPHKQNFFSKVISFLTEADDEGEADKLKEEHGMAPSDENKNILDELDKEDKKKKKKKIKGKKGQSEETRGEEDENEEDVEDKKKTKKKKKKEKPPKTDDLDSIADTKPVKKVSKKNVAIITGLCLTLTAMIIVLCSIVPGFFEKRKARDAYYQSDYSKSYELLYGKKLDNSDTIIFNKSKVILELSRKLDSYHNYLSIGKEVHALDALMSGVENYPDILLEAEEYHVTQEVSAIYETILNILNDKYDTSEPVAKVIISYDDLSYTRKLESLVNHTPFIMPEEEDTEKKSAVADVLPEEQDMLESDDVTEGASETTAVSADGEKNSDTAATAETESEDTVTETADNTTAEDELPIDTSEELMQEELTQEEPAVQGTQGNTSGGQGQLIQGISQPINIEIHGN